MTVTPLIQFSKVSFKAMDEQGLVPPSDIETQNASLPNFTEEIKDVLDINGAVKIDENNNLVDTDKSKHPVLKWLGIGAGLLVLLYGGAKIGNAVFKNSTGSVGSTLKSMSEQTAEFFEYLPKNGIEYLGKKFPQIEGKGLWARITNGLGFGKEKAEQVATEVVEKEAGIFKRAYNTVADKIKGAWSTVKGWFGSKTEKVVNNTEEIVDTTKIANDEAMEAFHQAAT